MKRSTSAWVTAIAAVGCALACTATPADQTITVDAPFSSEASFGPVSNFLDHRCGSLDCHGSLSRNFIIWGCEGLRAEPYDVPICSRAQGGRSTTTQEHQNTYNSLVALEPTVMSTVIASQGQNPDLLTFVRKARGEDAHKGGTLVMPGDNQDVCITSWLEGATDTIACANAIMVPAFPPVPSQ